MAEFKGLDAIQKQLLEEVSGLHEMPEGAYSLRINGALFGKNSSAHIRIEKKTDVAGIDIFIEPGTKNESVHIPVLLAQTGLKELVYNDFHIGEDCDVTIVAGCGIHNGGAETSEHSGIHRFWVGERARVRYVEKHYGEGEGTGERVMNPTTEVHLAADSYMEMETAQIKGVDSTRRETDAELDDRARDAFPGRSQRCRVRYARCVAFGRAGYLAPAVHIGRARQQPLFRAHRVRCDYHGRRVRYGKAGDCCQSCRGIPDP